MTFSDLRFIFIFLPCLLILYFHVPKRLKGYVLLVGSIVFYGLGSLWQTGLLAADVLVNYFLTGTFANNRKIGPGRKFWFWLTITLNAGLLVWFKCRPPLPVGISFYTFQMIAYQVDVYRHNIPREQSLKRFSTYMFLFPKLQQGPITRYGDLSHELRYPVSKAENIEAGFSAFAMGLSYKVLLADKLGGLWKQLSVIGYDSVSTPMAWLGMAAFTLELYYDFHGYSLMALGVGQMFGLTLPRNFTFPYCSKSISEFYRRWHVTLGTWFRDYVYIPLGGSRCGMACTILNLLIVWVLTGLWHGVGWNFVLWGLSLFVLIALEKLFLKKWLEKVPVLAHIYVLFFIPLTWMLFANTDFPSLLVYFERLFPLAASGSDVINLNDWMKYGLEYLPYLLAGCTFLVPWPEEFLLGRKKWKPAAYAVLLGLFLLCIVSIHNSASNPFMYLQF